MAGVMVPFANGKGGVGKTALACSFAVAQAKRGASVIVTDLNDLQSTAVSWSQVRDANAILPKIRVESATPRRAMEMIGRADFLVVDTPGWTDKSTLALAKRSTFMVIPTGPNPTYELAPTIRLLHGLRHEGIEEWRLGVVLSRFRTDGKHIGEEEQFARAYLAEAGYRALDGYVRNLPVYGTALAEGYGMTEVGRGDALDEVTRVMQSIETGVANAERQLVRQPEPQREKTRERGGRDER